MSYKTAYVHDYALLQIRAVAAHIQNMQQFIIVFITCVSIYQVLFG